MNKTLFACCQLMRLDKPIGALLLLWPTLWALWLAGTPSVHLVVVFVLGVFIMRAAGCVVNDFADRDFDGHVERTKSRPLPNKLVTTKQCKLLFLGLIVLAFLLVLTLNRFTILLSLFAVVVAVVYPFMKRYTHLPQLVLGVAFSWGIPMAYAASINSLPLTCWLLFLANISWTIAYDTQYAMVDREDDLKIGVKSTAILFGQNDKLIIGLLQLLTLVLFCVIGWLHQFVWYYYLAVLIAGGFFVYQQKLIARREPKACFKAFLNNNYVGAVLFIGILFVS
ncbi:4-hydroxybenzoate octaprenyltransferase [Zophobihabitans entericus]|uniref:4-hydroxybenzoate octaprenyltransferase n=1 Tax=Zophobihabitans entericus TaxID=1635327 RepID=A0A6G9IAN4_9GAMM|nr:4-hydroxybenzoate octaprenyltransferase [Zophobihabitans entericus]QIQ20784.1 4-hydroxybenzoate octaprenyltransferase [Zophobihabitans entericus]